MIVIREVVKKKEVQDVDKDKSDAFFFGLNL